MKKELKIIAVVLVAILVFVAGFGLGSTKGITITVNSNGSSSGAAPTTPAAPETTTAAPAAPETTTAAPENPVADAVSGAADAVSDAADAAADVVSGAVETADKVVSGVPATPDAVAEAYVKAINDLKKYSGTATVHKVSNVDLHVTDCSVSFVRGTVDSLVQKFITGSDDTWTFTGGQDPEGRTLNDKIVPSNRDAALQGSWCTSATATQEGDGYTMNITLNNETSTFDGTNTVNPEAHSACLDPLNLATLDLGPATITEANMTYPGANLTATVDGEGRLTKLVVKLPMSGSGTGKLGVSLTIGLEGEMNDTYDVTYE